MSQKSASYTAGAKYACMFLCEAALGNIHNISVDDCSLKAAPDGHDSVLAVGETSPVDCEVVQVDGRAVPVPPQSEGVPTNVTSNFLHDEFLWSTTNRNSDCAMLSVLTCIVVTT